MEWHSFVWVTLPNVTIIKSREQSYFIKQLRAINIFFLISSYERWKYDIRHPYTTFQWSSRSSQKSIHLTSVTSARLCPVSQETHYKVILKLSYGTQHELNFKTLNSNRIAIALLLNIVKCVASCYETPSKRFRKWKSQTLATTKDDNSNIIKQQFHSLACIKLLIHFRVSLVLCFHPSNFCLKKGFQDFFIICLTQE